MRKSLDRKSPTPTEGLSNTSDNERRFSLGKEEEESFVETTSNNVDNNNRTPSETQQQNERSQTSTTAAPINNTSVIPSSVGKTIPPVYDDVNATPAELQNLVGYKSNGVDDSLLRKYILNPYIYETSIKLFPNWIAPNMITLTGFCFVCISFFFSYIYTWGGFHMYYCQHVHFLGEVGGMKSIIPNTTYHQIATSCVSEQVDFFSERNLTSPFNASLSTLENFNKNFVTNTFLMGYLPRWVFFINALCIFLYQTFDNLDGKQARNMKQSSPLGEMFDHGVDALTCTLGGMAFLATAAAGNYGVWTLSDTFSIDVKWFYLLLLLFSGDLPFITATWEESHIGYLYLGYVNGPIEGVLSIVFSQLIGLFAGAWIFQWQPLGFVWEYCPPVHLICILGSFSLAIVSAIMNMKKVCFKERSLKPIIELFPFFCFITFIILAFLINTQALNTIPLVALLGFCFQFGYLSSNITLSHLLKRKLPNVLDIRYVIIFALQLCSVFAGVWGLAFYTVVTALIYFNFVLSVCHTVAGFLRINVLTITPPKTIVEAPVTSSTNTLANH
ncbi:hypothetical protein FDP41_011342 [Naegleria fowleri]|uniref:Uncharacterized protein n=1 Tax=Naegleria fowleri TaxID=5763 RepID=A0A6A5C6E7_NAEFO|nr:uncharacterized protein FDP41_011342 [Naegleria fowleri]KAF0982412.1 hypothetical protein FDP41_011342 [Naegleria fowleri]CAG4710956.1 unnamed protein product [Naegleria fowleri]